MGKYYQIFNLSKTSNMRITICHYYCGLSSQKYTAGKDFNEHLLKHKKLQFNPTDSEMAIMDRFAIPTLHCILGPCNKICDVLEEKWPGFLDWCKGINLVKDPYNNKDYNGNNCNKLLKNIDKLRSDIPEDLVLFVDTLEALRRVFWSCTRPRLHSNCETIWNCLVRNLY